MGGYNSVLNVKALVGAFKQEKALVGAFSVIVRITLVSSSILHGGPVSLHLGLPGSPLSLPRSNLGLWSKGVQVSG